jgi:hypothetical protein
MNQTFTSHLERHALRAPRSRSFELPSGTGGTWCPSVSSWGPKTESTQSCRTESILFCGLSSVACLGLPSWAGLKGGL